MNLNTIPFGDKTITIFNKYTFLDEYNKTQSRWTSYVATDGIYKVKRNTVFQEGVMMESESVVAKIPNNDDYVSFEEWIELPELDRESKFTVENGDLIVLGDKAIDVPSGSSPLIELKKVYPQISSISFTAKIAQANISSELSETSHFRWEG